MAVAASMGESDAFRTQNHNPQPLAYFVLCVVQVPASVIFEGVTAHFL